MEPLLAGAAAGGSTTVKIFLLLTALSFSSAVLVCMTSFTRIIIVLSFVRQALGTQQLPPNQVLVGLSLFLTMFIMAPTAGRVNEQALEPLLQDQMELKEAATVAGGIMREFLLKQTRGEDLRLFYDVSGRPRPSRGDEVPMTVAAPAFLLSELTTAFQMGLYIFIPMVLIDLLVASILMSLGMTMVPPTIVALPIKLAVFVMADGWRLVVSSLVRSFM